MVDWDKINPAAEIDRLAGLLDQRQAKMLDDMERIALRQRDIQDLLEKIAANMGIVVR